MIFDIVQSYPVPEYASRAGTLLNASKIVLDAKGNSHIINHGTCPFFVAFHPYANNSCGIALKKTNEKKRVRKLQKPYLQVSPSK